MHLRDLFEAHDTSLIDRAIAHFGLTRDPMECGYLLTDGRMLDLSGRHWMLGGDYRREGEYNVIQSGHDFQAGLRHVDHRDLDGLVEPGDPYGTTGMMDFMDRTGAVRVMPGHGFSLINTHVPTRKQIAMMLVMGKMFDGEFFVDLMDRQANSIDYGNFLASSPMKFLLFLKKHFDLGL